MREVKLAYENVKVVDCLDLTAEGSAAWEAALKRYDERIDRVETRIAAKLRDQLGTAKNANEMFRIFSRYNALFVRAHIRGAIREYQAQLIQRVKDDIEKLHQKFKVLTPSPTLPPSLCVHTCTSIHGFKQRKREVICVHEILRLNGLTQDSHFGNNRTALGRIWAHDMCIHELLFVQCVLCVGIEEDVLLPL